MQGQMMGQNMPEAVKQAFPNAAMQSRADYPQVARDTLSSGLMRLSDLIDKARGLRAHAEELADRLGGSIPQPSATGQMQRPEAGGSAGATHLMCDTLEATLNAISTELGRISAAHG